MVLRALLPLAQRVSCRVSIHPLYFAVLYSHAHTHTHKHTKTRTPILFLLLFAAFLSIPVLFVTILPSYNSFFFLLQFRQATKKKEKGTLSELPFPHFCEDVCFLFVQCGIIGLCLKHLQCLVHLCPSRLRG